MKDIRLRHVAQVNPPTRAFDRLADNAELTFLPMEAVWPDDRLDTGQVRTKASVLTGFTRFQDGDVLVPKITPTFEASRSVLIQGLRGGVGAGTTELHILRGGPQLDARFLLYLTHSHHFLKFGEAEMFGVAGQKRVPDGFLRDLRVQLPHLDEQRRIADFLDAETSRINWLVGKMHHQMGLLEAKRLATVDFAWAVGQRTVRLGYRAGSVTSGPRGWGEYVADAGTLFFRSANLQRDSLSPSLSSIAYVAPPRSAQVEAERSRILAGDVLVGITGANTGWIAVGDADVAGGHVSQHVCLVRPAPEINAKWLAYILASNRAQDVLMSSQYGGTKTQLSLPDIRDVRIPVGDYQRQERVAKSIDRQLATIYEYRERRVSQLALLKERRQSLITAAVTGQLDVTTTRGVAV